MTKAATVAVAAANSQPRPGQLPARLNDVLDLGHPHGLERLGVGRDQGSAHLLP